MERIGRDPLWWTRNATRTFDQHWHEAGLESPYNPFPNHPYFDVLFDFMEPNPRLFHTKNRKIRLIVKSRDLMVSWAVIARKLTKALLLPRQEILLQSQTEEKGYELIFYAKTLWEQMDLWMRAQFPLKRGMRIEDFPKDRLEFGNGSRIMALAQGDTKINSYHPTDLDQDEAALQTEGKASYSAAIPACQNIICVSSAFPGWYEELVEPEYHPLRSPDSFFSPVPGTYIRHTAKGIPVLWLFYWADPARDAVWVEREKPNYLYESDWEREQNCEFNAGGGELIFAGRLRENRDKIIISEPGYKPNPHSNFYAGFDWGESNPTSFHVYEVTKQGVRRAIMEHYLSDSSPLLHGKLIGEMRLEFADGHSAAVLDVVKHIYSDPSIFWDQQAQQTGGFKTLAAMFPEKMFRKMAPGQRGQDGTCSNKIRAWWDQDPPGFQIVCAGGIPERTSEGTFDWGCPNLLWEMMRTRRAELGAAQLKDKNPTERLIQKHNHAYDDLCYWISAGMQVPGLSTEEKWTARRQELKTLNPDINVDSMIHYRRQFEAEQRKVEASRSWK